MFGLRFKNKIAEKQTAYDKTLVDPDPTAIAQDIITERAIIKLGNGAIKVTDGSSKTSKYGNKPGAEQQDGAKSYRLELKSQTSYPYSSKVLGQVLSNAACETADACWQAQGSQQKEQKSGATFLAVMCDQATSAKGIVTKRFICASAGDSRAVLLHKKTDGSYECSFLNVSHNTVYVAPGSEYPLNEDEQKRIPEKELIQYKKGECWRLNHVAMTRSFGTSARNQGSLLCSQPDMTSYSIALQPGEDARVLLCTDGITDFVHLKTFESLLNEDKVSIERLPERLCELAKRNGSKDNTTVILAPDNRNVTGVWDGHNGIQTVKTIEKVFPEKLKKQLKSLSQNIELSPVKETEIAPEFHKIRNAAALVNVWIKRQESQSPALQILSQALLVAFPQTDPKCYGEAVEDAVKKQREHFETCRPAVLASIMRGSQAFKNIYSKKIKAATGARTRTGELIKSIAALYEAIGYPSLLTEAEQALIDEQIKGYSEKGQKKQQKSVEPLDHNSSKRLGLESFKTLCQHGAMFGWTQQDCLKLAEKQYPKLLKSRPTRVFAKDSVKAFFKRLMPRKNVIKTKNALKKILYKAKMGPKDIHKISDLLSTLYYFSEPYNACQDLKYVLTSLKPQLDSYPCDKLNITPYQAVCASLLPKVSAVIGRRGDQPALELLVSNIPKVAWNTYLNNPQDLDRKRTGFLGIWARFGITDSVLYYWKSLLGGLTFTKWGRINGIRHGDVLAAHGRTVGEILLDHTKNDAIDYSDSDSEAVFDAMMSEASIATYVTRPFESPLYIAAKNKNWQLMAEIAVRYKEIVESSNEVRIVGAVLKASLAVRDLSRSFKKTIPEVDCVVIECFEQLRQKIEGGTSDEKTQAQAMLQFVVKGFNAAKIKNVVGLIFKSEIGIESKVSDCDALFSCFRSLGDDVLARTVRKAMSRHINKDKKHTENVSPSSLSKLKKLAIFTEKTSRKFLFFAAGLKSVSKDGDRCKLF